MSPATPPDRGLGAFRPSPCMGVIYVVAEAMKFGSFFDVNPRKQRAGASPFSRWMRFSFGPPEANVCLGLERRAAMIARA